MTLIRPEYRQQIHGRTIVNGTIFLSWKTGELTTAMITEDGRAMVTRLGRSRHYRAQVEDYGMIRGRNNAEKKFMHEQTAMEECVTVLKQLDAGIIPKIPRAAMR